MSVITTLIFHYLDLLFTIDSHLLHLNSYHLHLFSHLATFLYPCYSGYSLKDNCSVQHTAADINPEAICMFSLLLASFLPLSNTFPNFSNLSSLPYFLMSTHLLVSSSCPVSAALPASVACGIITCFLIRPAIQCLCVLFPNGSGSQ